MIRSAKKQRQLPLLGMAGALMLALPTASLAVVGLDQGSNADEASAFDLFTPASVDPELAARIADKARAKGIRFTPAGANPALRGKTVTVAIRVDAETANAISVRSAANSVPGAGESIAALRSSKFNLGTARGYQSFAREIELPSNVRSLSMPDLSEFEPAKPQVSDKPSRLQPRIELEDEAIAGRSVNTLDAIGSQTVDVGGSFSLSSKVDVTAGVRYSQERERLDPLTSEQQDSQAVYVGTQIRF
ncbi:hypothetical protein [Erythrobacter sp. MTPC3]|uniref:hypothetical protein n=1 Tax=Erythrobacter sp. MTPC3 TaxID=3056564 RepID=UPI0036F1A1C3